MRIISRIQNKRPIEEEHVQILMANKLSEWLECSGLIVVDSALPPNPFMSEYRSRPIYVISEMEFNFIINLFSNPTLDMHKIYSQVESILIGRKEPEILMLYQDEVAFDLCRKIARDSTMTYEDAINIFANNNIPIPLYNDIHNFIIETSNKGYSKEHINILVSNMSEMYRIDQLCKNSKFE